MGATATLQKLAARRDLNLLAYNHIMFERLELLCNSASAVMLLASEQCERDIIRGNKWKLEIYFNIYIWYVPDTLVAHAWWYIMWEELSVNHFLSHSNHSK